jgi:phosphate transport system permease protein
VRLFPATHREGSGETAPRRGLLPRSLRDSLGAVRRATLGRAPPRLVDALFRRGAFAFALLVLALVGAIVAVLSNSSRDAWGAAGGSLLTSSQWLPNQGLYGALPLIEGTLVTSAVALLIAVPVSLGIAIFLSELSPRWVRGPVSVVVELLAAIPSVVYGLWGVAVLGPALRDNIFPRLQANWGWTGLVGGSYTQYSVLTAGILLSIMIIPTVSSLSREVMRAVPVSQREAAYALGATRWEVIRLAVLPYGRSGLFGAAVLGLARALGETMAVIMVIGNSAAIFGSLLSKGATIPSTIANDVPEASGLQLSALFALGLILFLVSLGVNGSARLLVRKSLAGAPGA